MAAVSTRGSGERVDRLQPFRSVIVLTRWATLGLSLVDLIGTGDRHRPIDIVCFAVLVANGLFRTIRPLRDRGTTADALALLSGITFHALVVALTGYLASPIVYTLVTHVVMAGLARGLSAAMAIAIGAPLSVGAAEVAFTDNRPGDIEWVWVAWLMLVAVTSTYARRLSGEASRRQLAAMDRLSRLADANALLFALHRVAQTLPVSLDLNETVESTVTRLHDLFDHELAALLLFDETDQGWELVRSDGPAATTVDLPAKIAAGRLPPPLARAVAGGFLVQVSDLSSDGGPGLWPAAGSGLYIVLPARGSVVGLIALEHAEPNHFDRRDVELLSGYVEPAALAIDNARWFSRLRTVGAEEERNRLARDLHDRIGQSLAYLAFELDRLIRANERGDDVAAELARLRDDTRRVVSEVRETLYELRTEVTPDQDILTALGLLGDRLSHRSGIEVDVSGTPSGRLPLPQERELFRIAQEAAVNVERHANATHLAITWWSDGHAAILEVTDDGRGFPAGRAGRADSYGIVGMRERAASVGATLEIESLPGQGTRVRCVRSEDGAAPPMVSERRPG
ncbi:MAG: histidine kinase [Acidimicrobiales bacterium]